MIIIPVWLSAFQNKEIGYSHVRHRKKKKHIK